MFKKFFRPIVALAAICTLSLGLTACAQSEEDVDAYRDALAGVPGVIDVTASVQRPLPFTTTASMKVTIPADEKVLDAVVKAACGQVQMATASVYFEFHVKADAATVMMQHIRGACPTIGRSVIAVARDVGATGESVTVRIPPVADGRLNVTLQGDGLRASGALDVSQAIVQHLKDVSVSIETQHLSLSSTPQPKALQVLADLRAVDAAHPFGTIVLDDKGLVATVAGDVGAADGAERMLRESSSGIWADMQIAIGGDTGSDHTDAGAAGLELAEWIESELGVPVSTNRGSLTVPLDSVESFTAASQAIAEHNPERLRVVLVNKEAKPRFRVGSRAVNTALSPEENAYPQWVQWWQEFEKTELVEVVEVSDDGVAVWLTSDASDQGSVDKAERVAARIADEYGLAWYEVNNRRTEL